MEEKGRIELIAEVEQRYVNEWLGFVIPPGEDEFAPERGMLIVHSADDNEVWDAMNRVTNNQVVHVYFNGKLTAEYFDWAESEPARPGARLGRRGSVRGSGHRVRERRASATTHPCASSLAAPAASCRKTGGCTWC